MNHYFSYKRISTDTEKQNFARQEKALQKWAEQHSIEFDVQYEEQRSAKSFDDRKQFQKLDKMLGEGDTIVFKDVSRFTREAEAGYQKYTEWLDRGANIVFIDNPTISSDYIRQMIDTANKQDIVTKTAMESIVKLLIIVELDRAQKQREYISKAIADGIAASNKKSGRPIGKIDKMTDELRWDIERLLADRSLKQTEVMKKHKISRNTLKKYISIIKEQ